VPDETSGAKVVSITIGETARRRLAEAKRVEMIDEYGRLDADVKAFAPKARRHKELAEQIRAGYDDSPADEEFTAEGNRFVVTAGMKRIEAEIVSMDAVKKRLGLARFLKFCSFALKTLKDLVTAEEYQQLVKQDRTGYRHLSVMEKSMEKAA
jgi:hypothetical protein